MSMKREVDNEHEARWGVIWSLAEEWFWLPLVLGPVLVAWVRSW
jgi:hypothetical protein